MSGFYDITNAREGNLIVGVFSLAKEETKTVWLTTEERASYDQSGIKIRANTTVPFAPNLFGRREIRDVDAENSGGGGSAPSGERRSKHIKPDSPGVEDMGEGGLWYTLSLDDAEYMFTMMGINFVVIPSPQLVNFPLHTHITFIADDEFVVLRKDYNEETIARLYQANGEGGNSDYRVPDRSLATIILYRKDEDDEARWMISGPGVTEGYGG